VWAIVHSVQHLLWNGKMAENIQDVKDIAERELQVLSDEPPSRIVWSGHELERPG
jgi:hypothetical protein